MFEQSLYEQHTVATPLKEGDLFHNYEIKPWNMSSRLYKILGFSALGNILAILIIGQTSLLTMKGCDSPFVGSVCQVLDTVYVGSKLLGTDREYVDAEYNDTKLDDEDITYLDLTGVDTQPLDYPSGYFQIANPEQTSAPLTTVDDFSNMTAGNITGNTKGFGEIAPGIPATQPYNGGSMIDTPPTYPKAKKNVVIDDTPSFGSSPNSGTYTPPRIRKRPRPVRYPPVNPTGEEVAGGGQTVAPNPTPTPDATPISSDPVAAVEINKKPLADFADQIAAKTEAKEVDLNQPFMIVLNGVITADGKLDKQKSKFDVAKQKGDPKMIDVAKLAIEAVGESGFLSYLKNLNVDKVSVTLFQDNDQIVALISGEQKTPEKAATIMSGLNGAIGLGKLKYNDPAADERKLLDGATVQTQGNSFVLNFKIPKPIAQEMITKKLKEAQAKKAQQQKPNGTTISKSVNNVGGV